MLEGCFSLVMISIFCYDKNPLKEVIEIYENESAGKFILLIFLLP